MPERFTDRLTRNKFTFFTLPLCKMLRSSEFKTSQITSKQFSAVTSATLLGDNRGPQPPLVEH